MKQRKEPQRDGTFRKRNCVRRGNTKRAGSHRWRPGVNETRELAQENVA